MASSVYIEAAPSRDDGFPRSQKPAKIQSSHDSAEKTTEIFTDSGYSSQSTTPKENLHEGAKDNPLPRGPLPLSFFKKRKVSVIDIPTGQVTIDCFREIQPYFEKLLLEELRARQVPGTRYKPISTRLAMMGTSESDARPHIVVLCQPEHKRWVQNFVKKEIIVDICRPQGQGVPAFEIIVLGIAPRLRFSKSAIEIVANAEAVLPTVPIDTLCGIPICFQHPNGLRQNATFGGIIKVVTADGSTELLGITAGHALRQWNHDTDEDSFNSGSPRDPHPTISLLIQNSGLPNNEATQADDVDEEEDSDDELYYLLSSEVPDTILDSECKLWDFENPTVLGQLLDISEEKMCVAGYCYDWALFQPMIYKMNQVPVDPKARLSICGESPGATGRRPIMILSGEKDFREGWILSEPGRILLEGDKFIDSFMVTLNDGPGIRDGDSGSWVIDTARFEVYGQLVASDIFGSGYVIPMADILNDIKSQLGAQAVGLPQPLDILHARNIADEASSAKLTTKSCAINTRNRVSLLIPSPPTSSTSDILHKKHDSGYVSLITSPTTSPTPIFVGERLVDLRIKTSWEVEMPTAIAYRSKHEARRKMKDVVSKLFGR
ncbi:hypothetical protein GGR58DRAFT_441744 [Xylaria digitata]|nr:hypothetical protein GGR58DRAFT_441744 [Xylaria digitata]